MNIDHISVSRKQTWNTCNKQYKYRYHLKMVDETVPEPIFFTFGKIVHKIIEIHTRSQGKRDLQEIRDEVLQGKTEEKFPTLPFDQIMRLNKHLSNYKKLADKIGYEGEIEWGFYQDLDPPHKRCVKGFIDRLIIKDNHIHIIDYKTTKEGRWRKDQNSIIYDLQLACYCWVAMINYQIPASNIQAALYYLEDGKLLPVRFSDQTLFSVPKILLETYKSIENCDPETVIATTGFHCRFCDYRNICTDYQIPY